MGQRCSDYVANDIPLWLWKHKFTTYNNNPSNESKQSIQSCFSCRGSEKSWSGGDRLPPSSILMNTNNLTQISPNDWFTHLPLWVTALVSFCIIYSYHCWIPADHGSIMLFAGGWETGGKLVSLSVAAEKRLGWGSEGRAAPHIQYGPGLNPRITPVIGSLIISPSHLPTGHKSLKHLFE